MGACNCNTGAVNNSDAVYDTERYKSLSKAYLTL